MRCISVVIPCFNAEAYVAAALESVQGQALPDGVTLEVILVDDGSTDASVERAWAVAPNLRVLSQPNLGISAARNAGVHAAQGEWVAFLDADDLWPANSLALRSRLLETTASLAAVAGGIEQFVSDDVPAADRAGIVVPAGVIVGRLAGALLVRATVFDQVGDFSPAYRMGETIDWVARIEDAGLAIGAVEATVLRRRIHRNNSVQKREQLKADYLGVLRQAIHRRRATRASDTTVG